MTSIASFCSQHKTAAISLAICLLELLIVWGVVVVVQTSGRQAGLVRLASAAWVCGSLASVVLAVATLFVDKRRGVGAACLAVSLVTFIACGLPMMV
jgi:hypothetical protein